MKYKLMSLGCTVVFLLITPLYGKSQLKRVDSLIIKYHRSSIYSIMLEHPGYVFGKEIKQEFFNIPISDKYNDHNLSLRSILSDNSDDQTTNIEQFLNRNYVSKRLVAKWFDRSKDSGTFDMNLIWQRGYYDATILDYKLVKQTVRGLAMVADAGEELIGNTFVIVSDIQYIDKEKQAKKTALWFDAISSTADVVSSVSSGNTKDISSSVSSLANSGSEISDLVAGFTVTITSYLFRLEWNDLCASTFYEKYYLSRGEVNEEKKKAFENDPNIFTLKYVGQYSVRSAKTVLRGLHSNEEVIRKVCARALDENIVQLQRQYEAFKVKSPISRIENDTIFSPIGLKEGVSLDSKYEVLECRLGSDGKINYKCIGVIKPYKDYVWDNRFMADLEGAEGANLRYTAFRKVSGGTIEPGMLLREIK